MLKQNMTKQMKKQKMRRNMIIFILSSIILIISLYLVVTFTNVPVLSTMRDIWIETAMTTGDHQWLATKFFPKSVVDKVMSKKVDDTGEIGITDIAAVEENKENNKGLSESTNGIKYDLSGVDENVSSLIEEQKRKEGIFSDDDKFGNTVIINDREQGIKIVEVKTLTYTAKLVFIDDPSRIFIADTNYKGSRGDLILNYLKDNDAIVGINANGFADPDGRGHGGDIIGCSISQGEFWGNDVFSAYTTLGFDEDNRLIVGKIENPEDYNLRDAAQFKPALIIDGVDLIKGTGGWGLQPRTIVAQRADGVVIFLVADGRQPGYSLGMTMGEAAELLLQYEAVTAAACDGGSSSVLAYDGEIINSPSTPMETGRFLPNAFLVKRK